MKTASLVTGILSLVFCFVPVLGMVLGIVGICTAGGGMEDGRMPGQAVAGLTCGIIGLCIGVVILFISGCAMCVVGA